MDNTTDKSAAPGNATAEEEEGDKDPGQADTDTGESRNESDSQTDAPQDESEAKGTDEEEGDDTATSDETEEGETAESQLLTPEEIKKLPPELKAQYASMNTRFQQKMGELNQLTVKVQEALTAKPADKPGEGEGDDRPTFIDRQKLAQAKTQDETIAILEEGMQKLADFVSAQTVGKALAPIRQREAATEVKTYFEKYPERAKYRKAMGEKDRETSEKLTLDELFYAVAGKDIVAVGQERKDKRLRNLSKGNSESSTGTTGKPSGGGDIFDDIAKAGGHTNPLLL